MLHPADHQLGIDLRLGRPAGTLNSRVLEGMLRDLIGSDQSLLPPLLDVVGRPAFQALDPRGATAEERLLTRSQLLAELGPVYLPRVLERLEAFLDGYFDLSTINLHTAETPATVLSVPPAAEVAAATAAEPSADAARPDGREKTVVAGRGGKLLLITTGSALLAAAAITLAMQAPQLCRQLGGCGAPDAITVGGDLGAAATAAAAVAQAPDLPSLERAVADLERRIQLLRGARLSAEQQRRLDQLQTTARKGQERLEGERRHGRTLAEAQRRAAALSGLPADRQPAERTALLALLAKIPGDSLAHAAAQQQRQRLESAGGSTAGGPAPSADNPTPAPAALSPSPGGSRSGGGGWRGSAGSRSAPRPRTEPSPPVEADGGEKPAEQRPTEERNKPAQSLDQGGNNMAP